MPDYDLLLLCDTLVMDGASFDRLTTEPFPEYSRVADTFRTLKSEGRIELVDFAAVLESNRDLLSRMVDQDIHMLDRWVIPLRESLTIWRQFSQMYWNLMRAQEETGHVIPLYSWHGYRGVHHVDYPPDRREMFITHDIAHMTHLDGNHVSVLSGMVEVALASSVKRKLSEFREALRQTLRGYLAYVNANLILSNELEVGFHDWLDFTPFYATKFLSVGKEGDPVQESRKQVEKLFTVPFPHLAITDTPALMKALNDKRVADLRKLVSDAAQGKVEFNDQFAKSVLREVLAVEEKAKKWRNILGYLTMPVGFIPWIGSIAEKAVGEAVGAAMEKKMKQNHRWFYMLSDIAESRESKAT